MRQRKPCATCGGPKPQGNGRQVCDACLATQRVTQFWAKVDKRGPDECWEWQGYRQPTGYGRHNYWRRSWAAHRFAFMLTHNFLPPAVRHRCDNPPCCNPAHLEAGTQADNVADQVARGRQAQGEQVGGSKLTGADVRDISVLGRAGVSTAVLAERWSVGVSTINRIVSGDAWRHVPRL